MAFDTILTAVIYSVQALLAGLGVYVSLKPQPKERHTTLIIFFVLLAVIAIAAGMWQQQINKTDATKQQEKLSDKLLQSQLSLEFVKGQLNAIGE